MNKYIDVGHLKVEIEKHIKEIKDAAVRFTPNLGFFDAKLSGIYDVMDIIDSPQQEQPDTDGLCLELADFLTKNDVPEEKAKFLANRISNEYGSKKYLEGLCDGIKQEQPESSNGKFVFPKFLYARTVDNKTIDVSYAPQSMDAVEYIKNDPTEQPEVNFKIEERKWVHDAVDNIFPEDGDFMSEIDFRKIIKDTARYFYELGLNARKEE
jgi:hypothetical protein